MLHLKGGSDSKLRVGVVVKAVLKDASPASKVHLLFSAAAEATPL